MSTSLLRVFALIAVISTVGAVSASRFPDAGRAQRPFVPWPLSVEGPAIFDISAVTTATPESLLGVEVVAEDVCVSELASHGFWVTPDGDDARAFVRPAEGPLIAVRVGESVSVHGEVRLTATPIDQRPADQRTGRRAISRPMPYVYAYTVRPAWPYRNHAGTHARSDECASSR